MNLAVRARPRLFKQMMGNDSTLAALQRMLKGKEKPHCLLFVGPTGCGKTTAARIMAGKLGCSAFDLLEYNAADLRGIDTARDITEQAVTMPMQGAVKVFILDESHQLTRDCQEALLKVTEDVPDFSFFIFCTTNPESLIPTLLTRCTRFEFEKLTPVEVMKLLEVTLARFKVKVNKENLREIVEVADGCPRTALTLLGQVDGLKVAEARKVIASGGLLETAEHIEICRALVDDRCGSGIRWKRILAVLKANAVIDSERMRRAILGYLAACIKGVELRNPAQTARLVQMTYVFSENTYSGGAPLLLAMLHVACYTEVSP